VSSVLRPHQHSIGYTGDGFYKMAPTEGRVARPERRCGCRHGTPKIKWKIWQYWPTILYRTIATNFH